MPKVTRYILLLILTAVSAGPTHAALIRYAAGWPVTVGAVHDAAPAVIDLEGDGRAEIAVLTWDGTVHVLDARGREVTGFPVKTTSSESGERCPVAAADVNADGSVDIVWTSPNGKVNFLEANGRTADGWPVATKSSTNAAVAIQDLAARRGLEVFAVGGDTVYGFHADGAALLGWPVTLPAPAKGMPAVGDLDGDRIPEVVIAAADKVYAFNTSGAACGGWPATLEGDASAGPTIADIDGDGKSEVLIGTTAGWAYALGYDGRVKTGWPALIGTKPIAAPAAVADFDRTGKLYIVFVAGGIYILGSTVAVLNAEGKMAPGYPKQLSLTVAAPPVVGDVDGDAAPEIVIASYDGSLMAFEKNGAPTAGFPVKLLGRGITAAPALADVDGDRFTDVVVASQNGYVEVIATAGTFEPGTVPWPTLAGNSWRTGKYFAAASPTGDIELATCANGISVRWRALARDDREYWRILKGTRDPATASVNYVEIATVPDQRSSSYTYVDNNVDANTIYYYKIEEYLMSGEVNTYGPKAIRAASDNTKPTSALSRCYPNPFTDAVNIAYTVAPSAGGTVPVTVAVYDVSGKLLRTLVSETKPAGEYIVEWDGTDASGTPVASGVYIIHLRAGRNMPPSSQTVVLIR